MLAKSNRVGPTSSLGQDVAQSNDQNAPADNPPTPTFRPVTAWTEAQIVDCCEPHGPSTPMHADVAAPSAHPERICTNNANSTTQATKRTHRKSVSIAIPDASESSTDDFQPSCETLAENSSHGGALPAPSPGRLRANKDGSQGRDPRPPARKARRLTLGASSAALA
jgi:hypothetical protein